MGQRFDGEEDREIRDMQFEEISRLKRIIRDLLKDIQKNEVPVGLLAEAGVASKETEGGLNTIS